MTGAAVAALIQALIGGASLFRGGGNQFQDRQTFENEWVRNLSLDPRSLTARGLTSVGKAGDLAEDILGSDIDLSDAYAQAPPTFTGGGLPMPIGVTGRDPAATNPTRLRRPGIPSRNIFGDLGSRLDLNPGEDKWQGRIDPTTGNPVGRGPNTKHPGKNDSVDENGNWASMRGTDLMSSDPVAEADAALSLMGLPRKRNG